MTSRPFAGPGRLAAEAASIVALAVVAAAASNALAGPERRLDWRAAPPSAAPMPASPIAASSVSASPKPAVAASAASPPWTEVSGEEAERLSRTGVLFLDARRSSEYRAGHVAGARTMPVWEAGIDDRINALFQERTDQTLPIVVYCNGGECEDSHDLAQRLYLAGFDAVRVYRDGFPDWSRRGLAVRKGDTP